MTFISWVIVAMGIDTGIRILTVKFLLPVKSLPSHLGDKRAVFFSSELILGEGGGGGIACFGMG